MKTETSSIKDFADDKYHEYGTAYYESDIFYRGYLKNGDWDGYGEMFVNGYIMYRGHFKIVFRRLQSLPRKL